MNRIHAFLKGISTKWNKQLHPAFIYIYNGAKKYFIPCWFSEFVGLQNLKWFLIFSIGLSWKWAIEIFLKILHDHIFEYLFEFYWKT